MRAGLVKRTQGVFALGCGEGAAPAFLAEHARVFAALHAEKQKLISTGAIIDWIVRQGIDKASRARQFMMVAEARAGR